MNRSATLEPVEALVTDTVPRKPSTPEPEERVFLDESDIVTVENSTHPFKALRLRTAFFDEDGELLPETERTLGRPLTAQDIADALTSEDEGPEGKPLHTASVARINFVDQNRRVLNLNPRQYVILLDLFNCSPEALAKAHDKVANAVAKFALEEKKTRFGDS